MKKKKHLADLMEEDLLETIQQRINELNDNEAREHFLERLDRLKRKRDDQKNALLEQQRLRREERERTKVQARAAEEQARREREAQENFLERSKWLDGKWDTPDGIYVFIDTEIDSGFYGQNDENPFLYFVKSSEEDDNRLQFEWGRPGTGSPYMPPWTAKLCSGTTETRTPGMMSKRKSSGSSGSR